MLSEGLHTIQQLGEADLRSIIDRSLDLRGGASPRVYRSKTLALMFFESSTRTRVSFEMAAKKLGASVVVFDSKNSSLAKGETLKDTISTISSYCPDAIVIRSSFGGASILAQRWSNSAVINAGDGAHQHPTQALLDLVTLVSHFGSIDALAGKKIAIVGDISHSRVARSLISLLSKVGSKVVLVGPRDLVPWQFEGESVEISDSFDSVVPKVDIFYMLRVQRERIRGDSVIHDQEYASRFSLTKERFSKGSKGAMIMHPGPVFPGMEVDSDLAESQRSLIREQTRNSIFTRMAVLEAVFEANSNTKGEA
ncbi:aspartate carbamoyltransferase catalytic subunit [Acidithrix sp. C25]|uniref:aspartate carbamoyltransferase catalytic subunit n=1 Tax=Acidithrix sp. C25 TaxID=1671482 RepID=UPI00191B9E82|nr:aspartate carbamoyltransferase catalytic subunit [Acidithrix sp. C25]CAG4931162.1 unnamed protein product [Acidithrix sp. C25]